MTLYTESVMDQTDRFPDAFVREKGACGCDVMTTL